MNEDTANAWSKIISSASNAASSAMQGQSAMANSKREAKQAKKRTVANLLNSALSRNQNLFRLGQEHEDDINDYQTQALRRVARGFVGSLRD